MSSALVIVLHASSAVRHLFEAALSDVPHELVLHVSGSGSSAYRQLAAELAGARAPGQSLLAALAKRLGARPLEAYSAIVVASWSAGYAMVRELLSDPPSVEQLAGVASLDSWYASTDADGTASDLQLAGLVRYALLARQGERVLRLGATDVRTYGYASTQSVLRELQRLARLPELPAVLTGFRVLRRVDGDCTLSAYNLHSSDHDEHVAALREWGPGEVAALAQRALEQAAARAAAPSCEPVPGLARRCLRVLQHELARGVREIPGARHNQRIVEYLSDMERGGKRLSFGADEVPWCAALQSWVLRCARQPSDPWPHRPRAAVREIWEDAIAVGTARGASVIRSGAYRPKPGDLLVATRGGPAYGEGAAAFAATRGLGHVGRVDDRDFKPDNLIPAIDGNVDDAIAETRWDIHDPAFVGAVAYPDGAQLDQCAPTGAELEGLAMLDLAALNRELWLHGDPPINQIIDRIGEEKRNGYI